MKRPVVLISVVGIVAAFWGATSHPRTGYYRVVEVFDGDTIAVNMAGNIEKVRMIGIDTPETKDPRKEVQCYGPEASAYTHRTLSNAWVRLQADPLSTNRDRYDRLLRYVYLPDGTLYNTALVEQGYARPYLGFPTSQQANIATAAATAQQHNRGLYQQCSQELTP